MLLGLRQLRLYRRPRGKEKRRTLTWSLVPAGIAWDASQILPGRRSGIV